MVKDNLLEKERQETLEQAQSGLALLIKTKEALSKLNLIKLNTRELQALYDCIKTVND